MTPSAGDYLKTIWILSEENGHVRSVDIAHVLGHSRAGVSKALDNLKKRGYIVKERYGEVMLTESGRRAAGAIKRSNELIRCFLTSVLGIENEQATEEACRIEHTISQETADKLELYLSANRIIDTVLARERP